MTQPKLFDIPRTHPSRKQKLEAFKNQHNIQTHFCADFRSGGNAYAGCHMPTCVETLKDYGATDSMTLFDMIAKYCRLLEECDLIHESNSETEVVRLCAADGNIECNL